MNRIAGHAVRLMKGLERRTGNRAQGEEKMKTTNGLLSVGAIFALAMVLGVSSDASEAHHGHPPAPTYRGGSNWGGGYGGSSWGGGHGGSGWGGGYGGYGYHGDSRGSFGLYVAPRPSGYYQTVTETVLVEPERVEQFWVPPVYNTVTDAYGRPQTVLVRDGYMAQRIVPARYATVARQVWVPCGGPSLGLGFGYRF
jgi:hypothetical protein